MRLILATIVALALSSAAHAGSLKWSNGWDVVDEPLNLSESFVSYNYFSSSKYLTITYSLMGARPTKLYQVGLHLFCTNPIQKFGQFSTNTGTCVTHSRQGTTSSLDSVELGVVLTDADGNGSYTVNVGPLVAGTYRIQFTIRNASGCYVTGGAAQIAKNCSVAFEAPAIFGKTYNLTIR